MSDCSTNAFALPNGIRLRLGGRYRVVRDIDLIGERIPVGTVIEIIGFDSWAGVTLVVIKWKDGFEAIPCKAFKARVVEVGSDG